MKKNHFSVDSRDSVRTIYSSSINRELIASAAANEIFNLTKTPLTTVKTIAWKQWVFNDKTQISSSLTIL